MIFFCFVFYDSQWDQFEVRNRVRMAEKNKNHAKFVANALEDMEKKRAQKNEEMQKELEGSAYVIRKAQQAQGVLMFLECYLYCCGVSVLANIILPSCHVSYMLYL